MGQDIKSLKSTTAAASRILEKFKVCINSVKVLNTGIGSFPTNVRSSSYTATLLCMLCMSNAASPSYCWNLKTSLFQRWLTAVRSRFLNSINGLKLGTAIVCSRVLRTGSNSSGGSNGAWSFHSCSTFHSDRRPTHLHRLQYRMFLACSVYHRT